MSAKRNIAPRLSAKSGEGGSPSPFTGDDQTMPHTSISRLPKLPAEAPVELPAQRKCTEIQELRTKVESLGTKVRIYVAIATVFNDHKNNDN